MRGRSRTDTRWRRVCTPKADNYEFVTMEQGGLERWNMIPQVATCSNRSSSRNGSTQVFLIAQPQPGCCLLCVDSFYRGCELICVALTTIVWRCFSMPASPLFPHVLYCANIAFMGTESVFCLVLKTSLVGKTDGASPLTSLETLAASARE